jgi:hypothetical protein
VIELLPSLPDNVVGFTAKGKVTGDDYAKVLIPAVEAALGKHDKIRLLYILGSEFEGYSGSAMWEDGKVGMEHVTRWERIALVSDKAWIRHTVNAFGYLIPGQVKVFTDAEEADARAWITG